MVSKTVTVNNPLGIHARPAALIVQRAAKYSSEILLSNAEAQRVNGKSIMGVMMLAAEQGAQITVETEGADEDKALNALVELIESNFEDQS